MPPDWTPPERLILEGRQYVLVPPGEEVFRAVHADRAHRHDLEATAREGRGEPKSAPPERCPRRRPGDDKQCVRPEGHPGECAASWASTTVDWGHDDALEATDDQ